jgi:hypothetical protein
MTHRPSVPGRRILWWFLLPLLTFGAVTFAVVGYAAGRLRSRWNLMAAVGYFLLLIGYVVIPQLVDPNKSGVASAILIGIILISWLVGAAHVGWLEVRVKVRPTAVEPTSRADPAVLVAQQRLARRNEARALLTSNPALSAELRIGRPDLRRQYDDGGLIDINHVPAEMIAWELGIPVIVAEEIVEQRRRVGGFYSADDLIVYCDTITLHEVAVVRDRLLFTQM